MSKFTDTVTKYIDLYESGNGLSYGGSGGAFTQSSGLDGGGSGTGSSQSPIRFPGAYEIPNAGPVKKYSLPKKDDIPASMQELVAADNDGVIRTVINKLANKEPLTAPEQEIVNQIKHMDRDKDASPLKQSLDNDKEENEMKSTRTVMSDYVEMMNNPNRPRLSFSQT